MRGPVSGRVRVGFIGRLRGRTVAFGAGTVALKHGRLTVVFRLGPRTAAHALIPSARSSITRSPSGRGHSLPIPPVGVRIWGVVSAL